MSSNSTENKNWAVVGQQRAVKALEMGFSINANGYNIFVVGESGTGKYTAVMDILSRHRTDNDHLRDIAYVQNFQAPDKPRFLIFPKGMAMKFQDDMSMLIKRIDDRIASDLDMESYKTQRNLLISRSEMEHNRGIAKFEQHLNSEGFTIVQSEQDQIIDIAPVVDGETIFFEDFQNHVAAGKVPEEQWELIRERYFINRDKLKRIYCDLKNSHEFRSTELVKLKIDTISPGITEECQIIRKKWPNPEIQKYLDDVCNEVIKNHEWFSSDETNNESIDMALHFGVNVVVNRCGTKQRPVIYETNPSQINLFGSIEARTDASGELKSNMMMIKAGALHNADGGFIILHAEDILAKEGLWQELKKFLKTNRVVPEIQATPMGPLPILMTPQPVNVRTTVILLGTEKNYESLCSMEEEFLELFKVTAEFSPVMDRNPQTEQEYLSFIKGLVEKEGLMPVNHEGMKAIIAWGIALAGRRNKLSTHFSRIGDLIREAGYFATTQKKSIVDHSIVKESILQREYMSNLSERYLMDQIKAGMILIRPEGKETGIAHGIAILEKGPCAFGVPLRISVAVSPGKDGVVNIERESGLSGELHDKGMFLLEGCIRHRYARQINFAITASIAVEQTFYEIDGDSASVAQLTALLSAIANIPIRQDIAITGAVNQQGTVQPVGGITKKIQGFFHACETRGLTGQQGIIIPKTNIEEVILPDKIEKALDKGKFHIWTAEHIDQVMALMTGMETDGPRGLHAKVKKGLQELGRIS